jgi:hypothetical protein
MKIMILAAVAAALVTSSGAAFAQGTAGAREPVYGSAWAANQRAASVASASRRAATAQTPAPADARSASAVPGPKAD